MSVEKAPLVAMRDTLAKTVRPEPRREADAMGTGYSRDMGAQGCGIKQPYVQVFISSKYKFLISKMECKYFDF